MPRRKKGSTGKSGSSLSINKGKPQQRNAANARERARMRVLSRAFCRLKTTLPWVPADTKLSKLDTLRLAGSYIDHLNGLLNDDNHYTTSEESSHPMTLTWPFGFNRPTALLGGNGSSMGGGSEAEESIGGSSSCWEPESPTKDCVHLDNSSTGQSDLLLCDNKHMQMHLPQESAIFGKNQIIKHDPLSSPMDISSSTNNNILSYNFNQNHHHQQHQSHSHYGYQNNIMSIS